MLSFGFAEYAVDAVAAEYAEYVVEAVDAKY